MVLGLNCNTKELSMKQSIVVSAVIQIPFL